jgi:L-seryl-tRNA(Ser) seleniumtransferase
MRPPAVDKVLHWPAVEALVAQAGRAVVTDAIRDSLAALRTAGAAPDEAAIAADIDRRVAAATQPRLRPVFNLTGTVLHTNLGRALLPEEAIAAMAKAARQPAALEFDLATGGRGDRDDIVVGRLRKLTGAASATVVNNNAAAVLLVLNTLAQRKEVLVSRGELIEIGGAFRLPDIMRRAGCKLVEVGTTNRTHPRDFADNITARTGLVLKAHTSNYVVQGFTAEVDEAELAAIAHEAGVPFAVDLGAGALIDMAALGLPPEPTPRATLAHGADLVTFSGDKLLGGPQAGLIVGRADLVAAIKKNPLKRALRLDKVTLAALEAVLALYDDPDRVVQRVPTLRLLTRPAGELRTLAERLRPAVAAAFPGVEVTVADCDSQIGSGARPMDRIPSIALRLAGRGSVLKRLAASLRALPVPVIGRVQDGALWLDLRCLEDADGFVAQLPC